MIPNSNYMKQCIQPDESMHSAGSTGTVGGFFGLVHLLYLPLDT
jgi:hypothetical protein